jgi:D-arabinose 1-dehydrogenase-like Zn-dependent alcohol dehydrogenase
MGVLAEPLIVTAEIIHNRCRVIGSQQGGPEYLYEALEYVAKGKVRIITETFDIAQAYEKVASGSVRFRAVIRN